MSSIFDDEFFEEEQIETKEEVEDLEEQEVDDFFVEEESEELEESVVEELDDTLQETIAQLMQEGVLQSEEGKEYDADANGFKQLIEDTVKQRIDSEITNLPDEVKDFLEKRKEIPNLTLDDYLNLQVEEDYNQANPNDEQHAVYLIQDDMKILGYSDQEIADEIASLKQRGLLETRATKSKERLLVVQEKREQDKVEQIKRNEEQQKAAIEEQKRQLKEKILSAKDVKGFDLGTTEQRLALFDYVTKPVGKNGETQFALDKNDNDDLLFLYIKKNKIDMNSISRKIETKQTNEIKRKLGQVTDIASKRGRTRQKHEDLDFDLY